MKNLKTTLEVTTSEKWGQTSARAMKKELEDILRDYFIQQEIEVYETEKGFNVELFDKEGQAFALNINPVIKAYDFDIVDDQEITLELRAEKENDAKKRKEASDKKKEADRIKREQAKAKRTRA